MQKLNVFGRFLRMALIAIGLCFMSFVSMADTEEECLARGDFYIWVENPPYSYCGYDYEAECNTLYSDTHYWDGSCYEKDTKYCQEHVGIYHFWNGTECESIDDFCPAFSQTSPSGPWIETPGQWFDFNGDGEKTLDECITLRGYANYMHHTQEIVEYPVYRVYVDIHDYKNNGDVYHSFNKNTIGTGVICKYNPETYNYDLACTQGINLCSNAEILDMMQTAGYSSINLMHYFIGLVEQATHQSIPDAYFNNFFDQDPDNPTLFDRCSLTDAVCPEHSETLANGPIAELAGYGVDFDEDGTITLDECITARVYGDTIGNYFANIDPENVSSDYIFRQFPNFTTLYNLYQDQSTYNSEVSTNSGLLNVAFCRYDTETESYDGNCTPAITAACTSQSLEDLYGVNGTNFQTRTLFPYMITKVESSLGMSIPTSMYPALFTNSSNDISVQSTCTTCPFGYEDDMFCDMVKYQYCESGTYLYVDADNEIAECRTCEQNHYCPNAEDYAIPDGTQGMEACPSGSTSSEGAMYESDCYCQDDNYMKYNPEYEEYSCEPKDDEYCEQEHASSDYVWYESAEYTGCLSNSAACEMDEDYFWDNDTSRCISYDEDCTNQGEYYYWDYDKKQCLYDDAAECNSNPDYYWDDADNGTCRSYDDDCKQTHGEQYYWDGGRMDCVHEDTGCTPDEEYDDGICHFPCEPFEYWDGTQCTPDHEDCSIYGEYEWSDDRWECVHTETGCTPDEEYDDGICHFPCEPFEYWDGTQCTDSEDEYTIIYNMDGGEGCFDETYTGETTICTPAREGYSFAGWSTTDGGDIVYNGGDPISEEDLTLYAIWQPTSCENGYYLENGTCNSCTNNAGAEYTSDGATAISINDCYRPCSTSNITIEHAIGELSGIEYYNGTNICEPTNCETGWHIKPSTPDLISKIGVSESGNGYTSNNVTGSHYESFRVSNTIIAGAPMAFAVDYGDKGIIKGTGRCSTRAGAGNTWNYDFSVYNVEASNFISNLIDETGGENAKYCYCSLDSYTSKGDNNTVSLSGPWVFYQTNYSGSDDCAIGCPWFCATAMMNSDQITFRTAMFDVYPASPTICEQDANTITLHLNGGNYDGDTTINYNIESEPITLPELTREGYSFGGWYDNAELTGDPITTFTPAPENLGAKEYWAKWNKFCTADEVIYEDKCIKPVFWMTTTPMADQERFAFYVRYTAGTVYIDWGDGNVQQISGNTGLVEHIYSNTEATTYRIGMASENITGYRVLDDYCDNNCYCVVNSMFWVGNGWAKANLNNGTPEKIVKIEGDLSAVFPTAPDGTQPQFASIFENAINLEGQIPPNLFAHITGQPKNLMFAKIFQNTPKLGTENGVHKYGIPAELFSHLDGTYTDGLFIGTFWGSGLSGEIPESLFATLYGEPKRCVFSATFGGCKNLTGQIPEKLFCYDRENGKCMDGAPAPNMFSWTFDGSVNLGRENGELKYGIPENLFIGIHGAPAIGMFRTTFNRCRGLSGPIPEKLFAGISGTPKANMFYGTFSECDNLDGPIPANLFCYDKENDICIDGAPAPSMFSYTFDSCPKLAGTIPVSLFENIHGDPAESMFAGTFNGDALLTGFSNGKSYISPDYMSGITEEGYSRGPMTSMFAGTGLRESCPEDTYEIEKFDNDWLPKVVCDGCGDVYPHSDEGDNGTHEKCYAKVTFVSNDGTEDIQDRYTWSADHTDSYSVVLPTLSDREGFVFLGWTEEEHLGGAIVNESNNHFAGDITLHAVWGPAEFVCDSGKWLHVGDNAQLCLSENRPETDASSSNSDIVINVQLDDGIYYLRATPNASDLPVNEDFPETKMKLLYKDQIYNVHDESISSF